MCLLGMSIIIFFLFVIYLLLIKKLTFIIVLYQYYNIKFKIGRIMANNINKEANIQEQKLVHDSTIDFKVQSLRNKMLAEWAADIIGYDEAKIKVYIEDVNKADIETPGDDDVIDKIYRDFQKTGHDISRKSIKDKIIELDKSARSEITGKA